LVDVTLRSQTTFILAQVHTPLGLRRCLLDEDIVDVSVAGVSYLSPQSGLSMHAAVFELAAQWALQRS